MTDTQMFRQRLKIRNGVKELWWYSRIARPLFFLLYVGGEKRGSGEPAGIALFYNPWILRILLHRF